ncbi:inward rectifier potassium channel 16-like [Centropristis striata]|uniref:inward rectifier potassium channel 16-like n=1 Tax=Centropristis striata TaxID=184440 RepID=UPI0027E0F29E|nr:inward rectifier potassium channel 16-like [Centropristis striata]
MSAEESEQVIIDTHHTTIHTLSKQDEDRRLRYMKKDGRLPVVFQNHRGHWSPYLMDIFTTLVEIRWRVMLLVFSLSYILSWLFFGLCYWLIAYVHGDVDDVDQEPCVYNVHGFTAAFLFSMETQATIGYGFRGMSENCMVAIIVVTVQDVLSCLLDTIVIGIVITKMASARKRAQTVGFSSCAVVNLRDGVLCLSWRLGDFRGNHILEGVVKAMLVRYVKQPHGSIVMSYQDLHIQNRDLVLATPATIIHKIEPGSPLYSLGPDDLLGDDFELVVSFTYTGDSTGMLHQTRISYTPADIRWGQRFQDMLKLGKRHYKVDYALFNVTMWVPVPLISAEEFERTSRPVEGSQTSGPLVEVKRNGHTCKIIPDIIEEVTQQTFL